MATREHGLWIGLIGAVSRITLIGLFTGVETVALVAWLGFVGDAAVASRAAAIGLGVLFGGLVVEHLLTDLAVNGVDFSFPAGSVAAVSATETALWALWLLVADRVGGTEGVLVAGAALAVLLVFQHTVEDNALRGRNLLARLLDPGTATFSVVEAAGATAWLLLVTDGGRVGPLLADLGLSGVDPAVLGVGVLAVALLVEHSMGVGFSRRG